MMMSRSLSLLISPTLLLAMVCGCTQPPQRGASLPRGQAPPELSIKEWINPGKPLPATSLASLRGRVVVLDFWATWCPPCVESIPHLKKLNNQWSNDGLTILSVHSPDGQRADLESFAREHGIDYPIGLDPDGSAAKAYRIETLPHAFVIDRGGRLVWDGHSLDPAMNQAIAKALKG